MDEADYIAECHKGFAYYGFTQSPLSIAELVYLYREGYSVEDAYSVACDVNAEVSFDDAVYNLHEDARYPWDYAEEYEHSREEV